MRQQTRVELQIALDRASAVLSLVVSADPSANAVRNAAEAALKLLEDAHALVATVEGEPS